MSQEANNSGFSKSLWMEVQLPTFPKLEQDLETEICIVGAGIAGLTCAYTLIKAGKKVVILDQGAIAGGQSARTTGHLTWVLDDRFYDLIKLFGQKSSQKAAESHAAAVDYIEKIVFDEKIDCDFERVDGYLFAPPEDNLNELEKEYKAITSLGMQVQKASRAPFSTIFNTGTCLQFPNQAQFHIIKYLKGLLETVSASGQIYSNTHVDQVTGGSLCRVETKDGKMVVARHVIVTTCTPVNNRFIIHTKQAAYRTYVIAGTVSKDSVPKGLYWDTLDPYHYIRVQRHLSDPNLDWVLIGGEDHKTGQDLNIEEKYEHLEKWARERLPNLQAITYKWSGQVFEPVDSLAFIGKNPRDKNVYICTGDSGNGLIHGTIAGMLIPDLIMGKENEWESLYEPSRKTPAAVEEYAKENLNAVWQYRDWFTEGETEQIDQLPRNKGIILREGIKKVAVFRDGEGKLHINSAVCPHLGGCLRWNDGEKSWDCPVHGSRFDGCGKVITGPASSDIKPLS